MKITEILKEDNWTYDPPLTLNDVALMKKLRAAVNYHGDNIPITQKPNFSSQERNRLQQVLNSHPPSDAKSYSLIKQIVRGNTLNPADKPIVDKIFKTYLTPPAWTKQQATPSQQQTSQSAPASAGQEDSPFMQGFMQGLGGAMPGPTGATGSKGPTPGAGPGTPPPTPNTPMGQMPAKNMGPVQTAFPRLSSPIPRLK